MQLETLRIYCDVVRLRSMSRGAGANGVTQSAASQAMQQLETDYRSAVRALVESANPDMPQDEVRARYNEAIQRKVEGQDITSDVQPDSSGKIIDLMEALKRSVAEAQSRKPAAAKQGGNKDFSIVLLPQLNHLFQTSRTGLLTEYGQIEETISPIALKTISDCILKHTASH